MNARVRQHSFMVALLWAGLACSAGGGTPFWRVARLRTPPTLDGTIGAGEYAECPAMTGMITEKSVVTRQQDVVWYIGYDDHNLYMAMRSPHPKGTWPIANVKENDDGSILWDDHVEIQFATRGRMNATTPGLGFYKIMANGRGAWTDEWLYNGTAGSESIWSMAGDVKSTVTDDHWDLEIVTPIRAFGEDSLDGCTWVTQLVRADSCAGNYFAGWVRAAWLDWHAFGEIAFDPGAPVFRLLDLGEIRKGDLALHCEVLGRGPDAVAVEAVVTLAAPDGQELFREAQQAEVGRDEKAVLAFRNALELPEGVSSLHISARCPDTDRALYEATIPVWKLTEEVWKVQVEPWLERRPKAGDFRWRFAYWASYGVAESTVDVDFFGMDAATLNAKAFEVSVHERGGGVALARARADLRDRKAALILETGELAEGEYTARMRLFAADGTRVLAEREEPFSRARYPWEGNELGAAHTVFPPFTPIEVDAANNVLKPCLREYRLGADGLPAAIRAAGGEKLEDILTGPVRLEAEVEGRVAVAENATVEIAEAEPARVRVTSSCTLGPAQVRLAGEMLVDGWYDVTLTVSGPPPSALDRLTLVMPLWAGADTLYMQRITDGPANGKNGIPPGDGVVWHSGLLLKMGRNDDVWKSFVPIAFVGNGDKGLWWFGEENRDWVMSDELPAVQVVRTGTGIELRINVLAARASLARPRTIRFALLADPVKSIAHERKIGWGKTGHDFGDYLIFGWRKWGRSADGYYVTDEDIAAIDLFLRGVDRRPQNPRYGGFSDAYMAGMFARCRADYQAGRKLVIYGSNHNMMYDLPEFGTFGGEWAGKTVSLPDRPLAESQQGYNVQGSFKITQRHQTEEVGCNWVNSQVECFLWYHHKILAGTPVNGTWWDNSSSFQIKDYDPETKTFFWRWSVFMRHELCRRLNTIGWQLGREPWWLNNMGADWSFNQVAWHVENGFDDHTPEQVMLDHKTVPEFRALFRTRRGIVHLLAAICYAEKHSPAHIVRRRHRLRAGLCLLHDIGTTAGGMYRRGINAENKRLSDLMDRYVGFFDEEPSCHFIGYWRIDPFVAVATPGVYVSAFTGHERAMLVAVNENREDTSAEFSVQRKLLGRDPVRMFDAETGRPLSNSYYYDEQGKVQRAWGDYRAGSFPIEGHGIRLIVVE